MARPSWDGVADACALLREALAVDGLPTSASAPIQRALAILSSKVDGAMSKEEFREIRRSIGRTQEDLASDLGVRTRTISRYENGEVPIPAAIAAAVKALSK